MTVAKLVVVYRVPSPSKQAAPIAKVTVEALPTASVAADPEPLLSSVSTPPIVPEQAAIYPVRKVHS
jgi:hypothetical protein